MLGTEIASPKVASAAARNGQDPSGSLVIVGGDTLLRAGLRRVLEGAGFEIAADAAAIASIISAQRGHPDPTAILLLAGDAAMDEIAVAADEFRSVWPDARVAVLGAGASGNNLQHCAEAGIAGYLTHDTPPGALMQSLRLVLMGESVFSPFADTVADDDGKPTRPLRLTERDAEILTCLTDGASNAAIARELRVPDATIKSQVRSVLLKIGVRNRTQAALWALENGLGRSGRAAA